MKKEPAKINYWFKGAYIELWKTISSSFCKLWKDIKISAADTAAYFKTGFGEASEAISGAFNLSDFSFDTLGEAIKYSFKFGYSFCKLICVMAITTALTTAFSLIHILIILPIMALCYLTFSVLWLMDSLYIAIKGIRTRCSNTACQREIPVPMYVCECGKEHRALRPGKYGIFKRTCECGRKLPTTFLNGRSKLKAKCPHCKHDIADGGLHRDICIPVIGGKSAGKTCFVNTAITALGKRASKLNLDYEYHYTDSDDYDISMDRLKNGYLPGKTSEMRLKYYQFYLTPKGESVRRLISLCDVAGETYEMQKNVTEQIAFSYSDSFMLVIDPLSVSAFRSKVPNHKVYNASVDRIDDIMNTVNNSLRGMKHSKESAMKKINIAVVITKGDIPQLCAYIGENAIRSYMKNHCVSRYEALNALCRAFFIEHNESNFLNALESSFKSVQFFVVSSLGHNPDGTPFVSDKVDEPLLWLIDKECPEYGIGDGVA